MGDSGIGISQTIVYSNKGEALGRHTFHGLTSCNLAMYSFGLKEKSKPLSHTVPWRILPCEKPGDRIRVAAVALLVRTGKDAHLVKCDAPAVWPKPKAK